MFIKWEKPDLNQQVKHINTDSLLVSSKASLIQLNVFVRNVTNFVTTAISKYVILKMTEVSSKHVWQIKESCYVYVAIYIVAAI